MNQSFFKQSLIIVLLVSNLISCKSKSEEIALEINSTSTGIRNLVVDFNNTGIKIQPTMYGIFFEDINFAADGGLYAELIKNRSFEFALPKTGWIEPNSNKLSYNRDSGILTTIKYSGETTNHNYARIEIKGSKYELINEGYRGIGVQKGAKYNLTFDAALQRGNIKTIYFNLIDEDGEVVGETSVQPNSASWKNYHAQIIGTKTVMKAKLRITFVGTGVINLDMISLFPEDTWKGRKKGLRKDIVELLDGLNPGFLRFPGGCIVEGRTLSRRYQWKKTVGNIENRETLINRWNTEFKHKSAPDYFQSFGLGFFEYFLLSEDLGAEPLPILSCGMACQFNTGELVPLSDLDHYVQDALDLIEFANGDSSSVWGQLRAEMGHSEPFNMKYIGIGNEQWGPDYIERYEIFENAIKSRYPIIKIVSGSGPFPDGDYFEYGWNELKKLKVEIVDEHYYKSPTWFKENATRYDDYDREGPKVFAGEYAAHPGDVEDGPEENNWDSALAEAAFMTGLERNADIVHLTSYAPLMAQSDAFQWAPDMIWFNNLQSYATPNYNVQKLFGNNSGTDLLTITEEGEAIVGKNQLFASAVKDGQTNELIIKMVNTSDKPQTVCIKPRGMTLTGTGAIKILRQDELDAVNSFNNPDNIKILAKNFEVKNGLIVIELTSQSLNIIKLKI